MGLLEVEIAELRKMQRDLIAGKIAPELVHARVAIYSQTEKRAKLLLQAVALTAKHGRKLQAQLEQTNLVGQGCIDTAQPPEDDKVFCGLAAGPVPRQQCLDVSGSARNIDNCQQCPHFAATRRRLLGVAAQASVQ